MNYWYLDDDKFIIQRYPRIDPREHGHPVPVNDIDAAPTRRLCVSSEWVKHIVGVLDRLTRADAWEGEQEDIERAISNIERMMVQLSADAECTEIVTEVVTVVKEVEKFIGGGGAAGEVEEMGQVVTAVEASPLKGHLRIYYGHCCYEDIDISALGLADPLPAANPVTGTDVEPEVYAECGKIAGLVSAIQSMLTKAEENYATPGDFVRQVRDSVPTVEMGRIALMLLWVDFSAFRQAYSYETLTDEDMVQLMLCKGVEGMEDTPEASNDEYEYAVNAIKSAIYQIYDYATATAVFTVWEQCYQAIGVEDSKFLMTLGSLNLTADCSCPDIGNPLDPVTGGWYLGQRFEIDVSSGDTPEFLYFTGKHTLEHDVYGAYYHVVEKTSGEPPWANFDSFNESGGTGAYDLQFQDNGSLLTQGQHYMIAHENVVNIFKADYEPSIARISNASTGFCQSDVVNDSNRNMPDEVLAWGGNIRGNVSKNLVIHFRLIHNTNSPSHTS